MGDREPDFVGWATKNDLVCTDGRIIKAGAFKHQDKMTVPLVWMHQHKEPENVLGHAVLENRAFGVRTSGFFNASERGQHMKQAVMHGDINSLSIYANNLTERRTQAGREVYHGDIKEVSLVLAGANPGATIDNISIVHNGEVTEFDDEAIIYTGLEFGHGDDMEDMDMGNQTPEAIEHAETTEETIKDVFDQLSEKQKNLVYYLVGQAAGADEDDAAEHGDILDGDAILAHIDNRIKEGFTEMTTHNIFENEGDGHGKSTLSHADFADLMVSAQKLGTYKEAIQHADYGIDDIEFLFPDAKSLSNTPDFISRRMEWVDRVIRGTKHSPFAKVKTVHADITAEEARAKGYIKGNEKKDEVIKLLRRTTSPTTVYKKQKLDRDDVLDITDLDVVAWLKAEIRLMLEEEIARAILVGDGRDALSEDKISDPEGATQGEGIRSILKDSDLYSHKVEIPANTVAKDAVKELVRARSHYRGTGKPTLFISDVYLTDVMLEEDKFGRPLYETEKSLADKLRVDGIVTVDLIDETEGLLAIMVNLQDYTVGSNKGGELTSFEDFDIDFNQHKYLMETRLSGALTKPKSAIVVTRATGTAVTLTAPSFNGETNTITLPNTTGVVWLVNGDAKTGNVVITEDSEVVATPATGYYIPTGTTRSWTYTFTE